MRNRKPRRFRYRSNGRNYSMRNNGGDPVRLGGASFQSVNGRPRNNFQFQQSAEKLLEKYNALAKEALSSGDRILSENYLQHADHFARIIETKNLNQQQHQNQNKAQPNIDSEIVNKDSQEKNSEILDNQPKQEKKE